MTSARLAHKAEATLHNGFQISAQTLFDALRAGFGNEQRDWYQEICLRKDWRLRRESRIRTAFRQFARLPLPEQFGELRTQAALYGLETLIHEEKTRQKGACNARR